MSGDIRVENVRKLCGQAVDTWGYDFQLKLVAEECMELGKAALKINRKHNPSTLGELAGEVADVELMIIQLECMFPNFREAVEKYKSRAVEHLKELLEAEHHG